MNPPHGGASPEDGTIRASAPGKVILFGEHSVVYGEMAVAIAVSLETRVTLQPIKGDRHTVNGRPMNTRQHTFVEKAVDVCKPKQTYAFNTTSRIPSASGMGSSAALATATCAALLHAAQSRWTQEELATAAYETEWLGQGGRGSPTDTSAATHGRAILLAREPQRSVDVLWRLDKADRSWYVHHVPPPEIPLVVAFSQQKGKTAREVAKVARVVDRSPAGRTIIEELGRVASEGVDALKNDDRDAVAALMNEAHDHLNMLGVSTSRLNDLVKTARNAGATGAKLTGAGGGGCIVAVAPKPQRVQTALESMGAKAWVVSPHPTGARSQFGEPRRGRLGERR